MDRPTGLEHGDELLETPRSGLRTLRVVQAIEDGVSVATVQRLEGAAGLHTLREPCLEIRGRRGQIIASLDRGLGECRIGVVVNVGDAGAFLLDGDLPIEVLQEQGETKEADDRRRSESAPIVRMVNLIVSQAVETGASDIHIEPRKSALLVLGLQDQVLLLSPGLGHDAPRFVLCRTDRLRRP